MKSYKIYLTTSSEVAARLSKSFLGEFGSSEIQKVEYGEVKENTTFVPAIYHNCDFYYCMVELAEVSEHGKVYAPTYDLTIC